MTRTPDEARKYIRQLLADDLAIQPCPVTCAMLRELGRVLDPARPVIVMADCGATIVAPDGVFAGEF